MSGAGDKGLLIDLCTPKAARYAVERWHYSQAMPASFKVFRLGVWEDGSFTGCIIFGNGASAMVHKQFGVSRFEVCELVRVALRKHKIAVSKMIKLSLIKVKKYNPGLRLCVSFADPSEGHHGGIYQAGNWIYTGTSEPTIEYFFNGRWRHVTDVYKRPQITKSVRDRLPTRRRRGKYRYVMPLDRKMRRQLEALRKQYPVRLTSKESVAPADQVGGGGVIPTVRLHNA